MHSRYLNRLLLGVVLEHEDVHHHVKHVDQQLHYIVRARETLPNYEKQRLAEHVEQA